MKADPRTGWLAAATLSGFLLAALAARARPAQPGPGHGAGGGPPSAVLASPTPPVNLPASGHSNGRSFPIPWSFLELVLTGVLLLAVIGLLVVLGPRLPTGRRARRARRPAPRSIEPAPDDLARQVARALSSTMSQLANGQIRDGVILCWHRLEQTAEAAGLPRLPADTSSDLAERLLASLPLSEAPLNRLATLYREARFSSHPIPAKAVVQVRADLGQLRSELEVVAAVGLPVRAGHG
ncbi:MAG: DUF4129 domain-containing protein [Jatrophihabitantaceae bacterium]